MSLKGYTSKLWSWIFGGSEKKKHFLNQPIIWPMIIFVTSNWHNMSSYTKLEYASEYLECSAVYTTKIVLF